MQKVISQKACQTNAARGQRTTRSDRPAVFSRAHQNHNIIYNPSIFGRRNICTAVPLINILSYNILCMLVHTYIFMIFFSLSLFHSLFSSYFYLPLSIHFSYPLTLYARTENHRLHHHHRYLHTTYHTCIFYLYYVIVKRFPFMPFDCTAHACMYLFSLFLSPHYIDLSTSKTSGWIC